ncbi:helix-turn-helix domain-containing protein [Enterococcus sp. AZ102]|uniref:helix-turn-helix domain-containing protein n=1 Tax=Enterococcus sp. AZ102 TaxID=2774865 RepID=UPI003F274636
MDINPPNRIKELRTALGMTQAELAEKIGVNSITLSRYENNLRKPKIDKLMTMSEIFSVPVDYITGESDSKEDNSVKDMLRKMNTLLINNESDLSKQLDEIKSGYLIKHIQEITNILISYIVLDTQKSETIGQTTLDFLSGLSSAVQKDDVEKIEFISRATTNLFKNSGLASEDFLNISTMEEKEDGSRRGYVKKASKDDILRLFELYESNTNKLDEIQFKYFMSLMEELNN